MGGAWGVAAVVAVVGAVLGAAVVVLAIVDRAVEAVRLQIATGRGWAATLARRLRLPLAAMVPALMFGSLAGVATESLAAGVATLGAIVAAMMVVLLVFGR